MSQFIYFQKYHGKENVHSSNVLYMLQKIYYYNPRNFYEFLKVLLDSEEADSWILQFKTQEKHAKGVTDFSIIQNSFKIVVEAKEKYNCFNPSQIERHLEALKCFAIQFFENLGHFICYCIDSLNWLLVVVRAAVVKKRETFYR